MRPDSYRTSDGCHLCKHCLIYSSRNFDSYFCGFDGSKHPRDNKDASLIPVWRYTSEELKEFLHWELSHTVSESSICDEFIKKP